ncbi:hypothetical protein CS176_0381 [Corynebacterium glutamicum]|uniref:ATP-grasp fold amidoligase family protein n=1 Tax=Corynebacterium glutamicum TaxID=1718 RepID=UPI00097B3C53|nr:ATP-grasp fold amidoligase family protein [Corynebacterium glutamicum]GAV96151.1 hypothetical protein CS176_0381 [Corynebacterium glutamicum]
MDYFERMERRLAGKEEGVPGWMGAKSATRPFADTVGVKAPKLFFEATASELPSKTFPNEFVLKPAFASTSIGVRLLKKLSPGRYCDLSNGEEITILELKSECQKISHSYYDDPEKGTFYVEQLLKDSDGNAPPRDIRVYAFQGKIGFILAEDHISGPAQASFYDENFDLISDVEERFGVAENMEELEKIVQAPAPSNKEAILSVAKRISIAVPTAFCRIDLYDAIDGVFLGELTFYPGTFLYKNRKIMKQKEADRLGDLWEEASSKLLGSKLQHATRADR